MVLGSHCIPCVWCGCVCVRLGVGVSFVALCGMIVCVFVWETGRVRHKKRDAERERERWKERERDCIFLQEVYPTATAQWPLSTFNKKRKNEKKRKGRKERKDEIKKSHHRAHITALLPRVAKRWPSAHAWEPNASKCSNPIHSEQYTQSQSADVR